MVSKKHMIHIANEIKRMPVEVSKHEVQEMMVRFFSAYNNNFDPSRFRDAC